MSSRDNDFSEDSFDDSSMAQGDEPPTLNETIFDISLFSMFMSYMKSQQLGGDIQFLKEARLFRFMRVSREILVQQAVKIIWTFFTESAPLPTSASPEVKRKLIEMAFDPNAELEIDKDMFSTAFEQIYNSVVPHFRNWISTNEWRDAGRFHRIAPPSFSIVLSSKALRFLFNKFIKSQLDDESDESIAHAYHLWKFCIIANDFREGKYTHSSHLETKKKKKKGEVSTDSLEDGSAEKPESPEEYAKSVCKKFKHHIPSIYNSSVSYEVFIIRALDQAIEDFDKSALFHNWLALKQYQGVDYQAMVVHQTLTPEGYLEPPTVAGCVTSSLLSFCLGLLNGTEAGANMEFVAEAARFKKKFEKIAEAAPTSGSGSSSTDSTRQTMVDEARRIFSKFLDSKVQYCDPRLVEEVRTALAKRGGKGVTPSLFRKCGAFIYQRIEHTWARELRATYAWANKSYDNRGKAARAVEEEFSMSVLPEGTNLQVVPSIDDTLGNPELANDYTVFVGKDVCDPYMRFHSFYMEYLKLPIHQRKPMLEKIINAYGDMVTVLPDLAPVHRVLAKEIAGRERVTDSVLVFALQSIVRAVTKKFYNKWLVEHSLVWKKAAWTPVSTVTFSDFMSLVTTSAIEKKIEEEAVKGKSGFSRYLAMRQVKKQSIANVRTASKPLHDPSKNVVSSGKAADIASVAVGAGYAEANPDQVAASPSVSTSCDLLVPSIKDTLSSSYLRKYFDNTYLCSALGSTDHALWEALDGFFVKYSSMEDEELYAAQDEMRKRIVEICDKFKNVLKNSAQIKERAEKAKVIFPQFFRREEIEIYTNAHAGFEKAVREKGWN